MTLLTRKRIILAKIESAYGTDSSPDGLNAILVKNPNFNPLQAELVSRDLLKPYFGNSEQLLATQLATLDFEVEAAGAGAAGQTPGYDCLLRACAFLKTLVTASISINIASSVATVTHADHGYTGTGNKVTIAGVNESDLNGIKTITVVDEDTYTYATTEADGAGSGTIVCQTGVKYTPISSSIESITMYVNVDGVLHKMFGSRGTVELTVNVKKIPVFKFNFTGLFELPTDAAAPVADFSKFHVPLIANTQNTPGFELFGYSGNLESVNFNLANEVSYVPLIGTESVKILDRKPAGSLLFEAPTMAEKDFFTIATETELGEMSLTHGIKAGQIVKISAPKVNIGNPTYQDSNGVTMISVPFTANPDTGNDELEFLIA